MQARNAEDWLRALDEIETGVCATSDHCPASIYMLSIRGVGPRWGVMRQSNRYCISFHFMHALF
jgi:hypothetical protein